MLDLELVPAAGGVNRNADPTIAGGPYLRAVDPEGRNPALQRLLDETRGQRSVASRTNTPERMNPATEFREETTLPGHDLEYTACRAHHGFRSFTIVVRGRIGGCRIGEQRPVSLVIDSPDHGPAPKVLSVTSSSERKPSSPSECTMRSIR